MNIYFINGTGHNFSNFNHPLVPRNEAYVNILCTLLYMLNVSKNIFLSWLHATKCEMRVSKKLLKLFKLRL